MPQYVSANSKNVHGIIQMLPWSFAFFFELGVKVEAETLK